MESWSSVSGFKNYASHDTVSDIDGFARTKNGMAVWGELKPSPSKNLGNDSCLDGNIRKNQEELLDDDDEDLDSSGIKMVTNYASSASSIRDVFPSGKYGFGEKGSLHSPFQMTLSSGFSCSKLSSSIVDSNSSRELPLIDLKLGRFPPPVHQNKVANVKLFSQAESSSIVSVAAKKSRGGGSLSSSQIPFCQVHGCKKDLSSCKDYHKRHKVCEIHSKSIKVIVNGVEQRFCQQCSRFHLLAEFDDGKRSCRKRLAGHNERRRKPHISIHTGRAGRAFHSYNGNTRFERASSVLSPSFVRQDILPGMNNDTQICGMSSGWFKNLQVEKPYSSSPLHEFDDELINALPRTKVNQKYHSYYPFMQSISALDFDLHQYPMFHNTSNTNVSNDACTGLDSPYICALSLLSSQSQNVPMGVPLIPEPRNSYYSITQVSEKFSRISPQTSTTQMEPVLISDGSDCLNSGTEFVNNSKTHQLSCEDGSTIDLFQLSS